MVTKKSKITSAKQLKGATVCVQSGTTTEKNLTDYSKAAGLAMKPVVFETQEATNKAYFSGRCQARGIGGVGNATTREVGVFSGFQLFKHDWFDSQVVGL